MLNTGVMERQHQSIESVKGFYRPLVVVGFINTLVKGLKGQFHTVSMEPYRQDVPEQNNKRHGSHEDGKRHVEVGLNVFGPPGWRSLRKRPRYEEGKRREGGKKEDQSKT